MAANSGLCECGCGKETNLARNDWKRFGWVKGKPLRFIVGHVGKTHGLSKSRTYRIWDLMKSRCSNPKHDSWKWYGGRGIRVCERWQKFSNFLEDMGECPLGLTLDRIDGNRDYEPGNCRWATWAEQARNRRKSTRVYGKQLRGIRGRFVKGVSYGPAAGIGE